MYVPPALTTRSACNSNAGGSDFGMKPLMLLTVEEICYFKADSKYTLVVCADSESLIKKTIKELAGELDPNMFWQIHRSVIVNVRAIDSVVRSGSSDLAVRLKQRNETLAVSEPHHHLFRQM
jgi:DNA-binding LytR/AlgR family response regulator